MNQGSIATFSAGAIADLVYKHFSFQTGLFLDGQGGEFSATGSPSQSSNVTSMSTNTVRLLYLRIPANIIYRLQSGKSTVYFGAGPYVATGLSGRVNGTVENEKDNDPATIQRLPFKGIVEFGGDSNATLMQLGADATAGIKFKNRVLLNINYDLGLTNFYKSGSGLSAYSRTFGVSLGYCLR